MIASSRRKLRDATCAGGTSEGKRNETRDDEGNKGRSWKEVVPLNGSGIREYRESNRTWVIFQFEIEIYF